ncbi:MlaD family protein [Magnetospira sp. QH-2]|uniref:MlaD family protein n=1 Tax=Magnetospira sp. (strain QH-2) TaxID=1288970 RepID=UPI0003E80D86|nr:MlaD family protein [Magnetospira sp. QH-2]CCQ73702.1 Putative toluene tolerance protein Ttg2C [Magnetospira sp. QH-2]
MRSRSKEQWVGAAALCGLAVVLALSYGRGQAKPTGGYEISASFNRVDGLAVGDEVTLGGIQVGKVASQRLQPGAFRAELVLLIDDHVKLPMDTSAAIHTDGLFGSKFVVLEPGGDPENMKSGDSIGFTQESMVVEDLLEMIISQGRSQRGMTAEKSTQER